MATIFESMLPFIYNMRKDQVGDNLFPKPNRKPNNNSSHEAEDEDVGTDLGVFEFVRFDSIANKDTYACASENLERVNAVINKLRTFENTSTEDGSLPEFTFTLHKQDGSYSLCKFHAIEHVDYEENDSLNLYAVIYESNAQIAERDSLLTCTYNLVDETLQVIEIIMVINRQGAGMAPPDLE